MHLTLRKASQWGAFFIACSLGAVAQAACSVAEGGAVVQVDYVVDGDTLKLVGGESVRIIGINTPETGRKGEADEPGAIAAKRYLRSWLEGRRVSLVEGAMPRDRYGRLLAHISVQGELVSECMLARGLGFAVAIPPNTRAAECLFSVEQQARTENKGLWQNPVRAAALVDASGFALLTGVVTQVDETRRAIYVEVDDHLVLRLDRELPTAGYELDQLVGKRVEIRGWVVDRGKITQSGRKRWFISLSDWRHLRIAPK